MVQTRRLRLFLDGWPPTRTKFAVTPRRAYTVKITSDADFSATVTRAEPSQLGTTYAATSCPVEPSQTCCPAMQQLAKETFVLGTNATWIPLMSVPRARTGPRCRAGADKGFLVVTTTQSYAL